MSDGGSNPPGSTKDVAFHDTPSKWAQPGIDGVNGWCDELRRNKTTALLSFRCIQWLKPLGSLTARQRNIGGTLGPRSGVLAMFAPMNKVQLQQ